MPVTINKLSRLNRLAIQETMGDLGVTTTNTTATFNMGADEALHLVQTVISRLPQRRGHPAASLHAVVRKLRTQLIHTTDQEDSMPRMNANTSKARTGKVNAKAQGFPACYLGSTGNFKPGLDARAKSDLRAAVAGKRTGKELHRFNKATAQKLLAARGW